MKYNLKLEKELIKLRFKKEWFSDKSAYWFNKSIKYKDLQLRITVESDRKLLLLEVKTGEYSNGKIAMNKCYDEIKKYPCTLSNIKMLIKRYK